MRQMISFITSIESVMKLHSQSITLLLLCLMGQFSLSANDSTVVHISGLIRNTDDPEKLVEYYNDLAWEYYGSDYDSAFHYTTRAIQVAEALEDDYWLAVSYEMMAILKELSGKGEEAIGLFLKVIALREKLGEQGIENTYNNMASLFRSQGNFEKALKYFEKSYRIEIGNKNQLGIAESLINMSITLKNLNHLDSVPVFLYRAKALAEVLGRPTLRVDAMINLAAFYESSGIADSAFYYYQQAFEDAQKMDEQGSVSVAAFGMASFYQDKKNHTKALEYLGEAEKAAKKVNSLYFLMRAYGAMAVNFSAMETFEDAYRYQQLHMTIKDSLNSAEVISRTNELEAQYANERKERQIAELQLISTAQALRSETDRNQRNLLIFIAGILIAAVAFVGYRYSLQQRIAAVLQQKNKTIAMALSDRETLLREIHHRVKNNLQVVSSLLSIQGREIKDEKALEAVNESKQRVQSMALIHQYLYSDNDLKSIDMRKYVKKLCANLFNAYKLDHDRVKLHTEVDALHLDIDTAVPLGIIINELIANALKYAFPNGRSGVLRVLLHEKNGKLLLRVSDDGVGMNNFNNEETSFGMKLLSAFKTKLGAEINIDSQAGVDVNYIISKYKRLWPESTASLS